MTMCYCNFATLKFVADSFYFLFACSFEIVSICKKKEFPTIAPPKQIQTPLFLSVLDSSTLSDPRP